MESNNSNGSASKVKANVNDHYFILSKGKKEVKIPMFQVKIFEILMKKENQNLIHWHDSGTSFIIQNIKLLERDLLPNLFKHNKFTSLQRQLHAYSFSKVSYNENCCSFRHPYFKKGKFYDLQKIKRKRARDYDNNKANHEKSDVKLLNSQYKSLNTQYYFGRQAGSPNSENINDGNNLYETQQTSIDSKNNNENPNYSYDQFLSFHIFQQMTNQTEIEGSNLKIDEHNLLFKKITELYIDNLKSIIES